MAVAEHIAMALTFTTDLCDTENGGIPWGQVPSRNSQVSRQARFSAGFVTVPTQMALGDTTVDTGGEFGRRVARKIDS